MGSRSRGRPARGRRPRNQRRARALSLDVLLQRGRSEGSHSRPFVSRRLAPGRKGRSSVKNSRRLLIGFAASLLGGFVVTACSPAGNDHAGDVGTVALALTGAGGVTISTVAYTITGPSSFSKMGTIDVSDSSTISSTIGGLPAATGFSIALSATSTD